MAPYSILSIDLSAVRHNLAALRSYLPLGTRLMPMVKASAYGTDALCMTRFLIQEGIDIVGVSHLEEALALRAAFPDLAIFVIHVPPFDAELAVIHSLEVALSNPETARALSLFSVKHHKRVRLHLDVNTGMHRFGCREDEVLGLAQMIKELPGLDLIGLMTHFVAAEVRTFDSDTQSQIALFEKALSALKEAGHTLTHIHGANSAGILRHQLPSATMARVGLALFGITSDPQEWAFSAAYEDTAESASGAAANRLKLQPALTLETKIMAINHCRGGESVGYLRTYKAYRPQERIAILPIGYYDGIHLGYSARGFVLIHGKKAPFVGRICMDFMMVDVTDIPEATVGDRVILFDKKAPLTAETFSGFINTNVRELLVSLGPRIKRQFIERHSLKEIERGLMKSDLERGAAQ